jgi:hypothetical protein
MNKAEVRTKCEELRKLVGDVRSGSADAGPKASMIANQILAAAPAALTLRAKSLREQLELWFGRGKLKTHKDIELCRQAISENMGVLEQHWDSRRPKRPLPGTRH